MQSCKLENTFYKEMEPFEKEGFNWNVFAWRINGNLKKYCKGAHIMSNE
jgi:hypothetical protein